MQISQPKYTPLENIASVADDYIALDTIVQMKVRNGMTRELYLDCSILNDFINMNDPDLERDERDGPTAASLTRIAEICAPHYGRNPGDIVSAFQRCMGLEFYDADRRKEIEEEWAKLLSS